MQSDHERDHQSQLFNEIGEFWSFQLNNEIYLRNHPRVERASKDYFDIILAARGKYIYYYKEMIAHLKGSPSNTLLEVGCGMGTDALVFVTEGFNVTGIDLAPGHIKLAMRLFKLYDVTGSFKEGNAEKLSFTDHSFGCAYSFGVLHHTLDTKKAIQEIHRVLVPGGRAIIMLYNRLSLNNFAHWITQRGFENVKGNADAPITYRFTKKEVLDMCSNFTSCNVKVEYLFGAGWGRIYNIIPRKIYFFLSKLIGWHLVIYLQK